MFVRPRVTVRRKSKKGKYRLFATSALVMSAALSATPARAQQPTAPMVRPAEAVTLNVAAGQLDVVLESFTNATGVTFDVRIPADTVAMMHSPGVSGIMPLDDALTRLLEGTGLTFRRTGSVVLIEVGRLTESVEVTGRVNALSTPKLTEPLRDVPQTITVISRAVIEEQGATTLRDVLRPQVGRALIGAT